MDKLGTPNPGEFVMIWNFKNEKPMSIAQINDNELAITVKNIGEFTSQLHDLKVGDKIGVRGSYGNGFNNSFEGKNILAIGGGVGMAPINAIASDLIKKGNNVDVVSAAVTKDELLYADSLEKLGATIYHCTDDGSFGFEGFATDCTADLLEGSHYDYAFVCGPEIMMKGLFDILEEANIPAQYSLERYMKCALGVCGQCCVDGEGWRICVEGPVFENDKIYQITEFGKYRRDASGVKY
jgi:dihydroorotate dehydrogenase electron transfer subunit